MIRAAADTVHADASGLLTPLVSHTTTTATITDATEPDKVIAILTLVQQGLIEISAHCLAGPGHCADLATLIGRNLDGAKPEWLVEQANAAGKNFEQAHQHVEAAAGHIEAAIQLRDAAGRRIDPYGNPVARNNLANHTPIIWDLS